MADAWPSDRFDDLLDRLREAEREVASEPNAVTSRLAEVRATLDRVEAGTPGGAPLHSQLDVVRKWLRLLEQPKEHNRFGGTAHIRQHVVTQLRLAAGALADYRRAMQSGNDS
jgi:hypothetical protein